MGDKGGKGNRTRYTNLGGGGKGGLLQTISEMG